ncbi:Hpt domain-containing protein [Mucilaginibacter sp. UR6-11]|uniref:Hpt domain-containing protein n=1 Tax=Mucilaginibacter sp. UR6-11 TaxID=1435644 RepID=UPI001E5C461A|nr:Hpt domain-containing protein [Mucilaginibacter sp. UR6-11]MCC8426677.1 Hpt domain-containing protein [Mucilaginibacter sp. UR6-11]
MPVDLTNFDLDLTLLQEIADGSDEFIVESIDMFFQQTPSSIHDISEAFDLMDWNAAACAAHKMKATLGFFGMLNCQALIQQIELGCKTGSPDITDLRAKFDQVQALITANTIALQQIKEEIGAKL